MKNRLSGPWVRVLGALALGAVAMAPMPATGQAGATDTPCAPHDDIGAYLASKYQELPVWRGLTKDGRAMFEIYGSGAGETWTLIVTSPGGKSCYIASGQTWNEVEPIEQGDGA